jgi:hypothetical protein
MAIRFSTDLCPVLRPKQTLHALDENGMVLCNPTDREAAHRAEMEGIATSNRAEVTCHNCLSLLFKLDKVHNEQK